MESATTKRLCLFADLGKLRCATPMWRNGRRNGLKIAIFAVSLPFVARQFDTAFLGKLPKFVIYGLTRWGG